MWWWVVAALGAPNLVVITLDTTRADVLSCYGRPPDLAEGPAVSPHVDALAADGVRFEQAWAHAPSTLSSHTTLFTGLDPHEHGVVRNGYAVPDSLDTLAERLSDAGWHTVAVVGGAPLESAMGLDQGFDVYDDTLPSLQGAAYQDRAGGVVARALAHVEARPAAPLFLFVHLFDPHAPYAPIGPNPWADSTYSGPFDDPEAPLGPLVSALEQGSADPADLSAVVGRYAAEVHAADAAIGHLMQRLDGKGLLDTAIVVVTADHGEVLGEHPLYALSHGSDVTAGSLHVPLVIAGHGLPVAAGRVVESQVGLMGLAGTLERLLGLEATLGHSRDRFEAGALREGDVEVRDLAGRSRLHCRSG